MTNPASSIAVVQNSDVWPSLLSSLCSLLSLLSSLFSRCCSFVRSHFAPVPSIFASGHRRRPNCFDPLRLHPWPGGMREAIKYNSPGLRPIGVSEPLQGCVSKFPDRAKWAPQGRRRRKSVRRGRGHLGPISPGVMAPCDLRGILTTQLRSPFKMRRFEPSIDLDLGNGFLEKASQLTRVFFEVFSPLR